MPATPSPADGRPLTLGKPRRNPTLLALALLLIIGCAAAFGALYMTADQRTQVLVTRKAITQGQTLTSEDLIVAEISGGPFAAITANNESTLLGQTAVAAIPPGTVLTHQHFTTTPKPHTGHVGIAITMKTGAIPADLTPGRHVEIHAAPPAGPHTGPPPTSEILVANAETLHINTERNGVAIVTVAVTTGDAPRLTAALDRLVVVLKPLGGA